MTSHTPGPWSTSVNPNIPGSGECVTIYANDDNATYVADVYRNYVGSERVTEGELAANASLIAAAPELLEACIRATGVIDMLLQQLDEAGAPCGEAEQIRMGIDHPYIAAAISKATGAA